jgi:MFS family permease
MVRPSKLIQTVPFFYGWVILAVGTLGSVMMGPSQTFTVSVFIDSFIRDLAVSRSNIALAYGLATLGASFLLPVTGWLFDRFGGRRLMVVAAFGLGLACIGMALVDHVFTLFLGFLFLRFTGFGSLQLSSNNVIAQWFIRRRGLVMGFAGLSLGIGLLIFPELTQFLIGQYGWRGAWLGLGLLVWAMMLPLTWLFVRDRPELYGLSPDGDQMSRQETDHIANEVNWTLPEARRTGIFWLFTIALSIITMVTGGLVFHQLSLFEIRGLSRELAVDTFRTTAIFSILGNLLMGQLLDRYSARRLLAVLLFMVVATLVLVQVMTAPFQGFIYGILLGLTSGAFRVLDGVVWARYFGRRYLGSIRGATMLGVVGGTAIGPYPLGFSFDVWGGYSLALNAMLIPALAIGLFAFFIRRPEK